MTSTQSETFHLVGSGEANESVLGIEVKLDEGEWLYCMVLPLKTKSNKMDKMVKGGWFGGMKPSKVMSQVFTKRVFQEGNKFGHNLQALFPDDQTEEQMHQAFRKLFVDILTSEQCGFDVDCCKSIDGDEMFVKIGVKSEETKMALAQRTELPVSYSPEIYNNAVNADMKSHVENDGDDIEAGEFALLEEKGLYKCPTADYRNGKFSGDNYLPAYVSYRVEIKEKLAPLREVDMMHCVIWRMHDFINLEIAQEKGLMKMFFPIHKMKALKELESVGWNKLHRCFCCDFANEHTLEKVRNYYGEEVAFFFHWLSYYTSSLAAISILSLLACCRRLPQLDLDIPTRRYIAMGFSVIIMIWSSMFVEKYHQSSEVRIHKWGMTRWNRIQPPRPQFKLWLRGTYTELTQNGFHWLLVCLFIAESVIVTGLICQFRMEVQHNPDATYFGLSSKNAGAAGKYMITANIKIVGFIWDTLSPKLTNIENHKTAQESKQARVVKLFIVKSVVYFYPFFYIAFLKTYFEGCGLGDDPDAKALGCIPELNQNLFIFFACHIGCVLAFIAVFALMTRISVSWEISAITKKLGGIAGGYSYVEMQSKQPQYIDDTDDFMELVMSLGMVMMFSAALPVMAFFAFICNLIEAKCLAWRMVYVNQRPIPRGQAGIGAWRDIIEAMCFLSTLCNVALVVFAMHPLEDLSCTKKLLIFVLAQNAIMMIKQVVRSLYSAPALALTRAQEINESVADELAGQEIVTMQVQKTTPPKEIESMEGAMD